MDEIEAIANPESDIRKAKEVLAFEATHITHGENEAQKARNSAKSLFGGLDGDLEAIPSSDIAAERLIKGIPIVDLMTEAGLASSKSAARRLIEQGGASINGKRADGVDVVLTESDFENGILVIRAGKKRYHRIILKN
jgi:tyrosyl-tRNA synthetase